MTRYLTIALLGSFSLGSMLLRSPDDAGGGGDPAPAGDVAGTTILTEKTADATPDDQTKPNPLVEKSTDGVTKPDPNVKKPDGLADEKKDDGKPDDKAKSENEYLGAVEEYDIKTPEGFDVDEEIKGEFTAAAKEIGLSQKGVERLVAIQTKMEENQAKRTAELIKGWGEDVRKDKEIGGKDFDANAAAGRQFLADFGNEKVSVLLDKTGLGNHPEVVRMFVRAGKAMGEARAEKGTNANGKQDAADILYGSS